MAICLNVFQYAIHSYHQRIVLTQKTKTIILDKSAVSAADLFSKEIKIENIWYDIVSIQETKSSYILNVISDHLEEILQQHAKKQLLHSFYFMTMYFEQPVRFEFLLRPYYSKIFKLFFVPKFQIPFLDAALRPPGCA